MWAGSLSLVTAAGTFDPDNKDPVDLLSKLEKVVDVIVSQTKMLVDFL